MYKNNIKISKYKKENKVFYCSKCKHTVIIAKGKKEVCIYCGYDFSKIQNYVIN